MDLSVLILLVILYMLRVLNQIMIGIILKLAITGIITRGMIPIKTALEILLMILLLVQLMPSIIYLYMVIPFIMALIFISMSSV